MATQQRPGPVLAPWLRRTGTGALQRPAGAFPPALCRGEYSGMLPIDAGAVLPPLAPPDETELPQAARCPDAQEFAPPQGRGIVRGGSDRRAFCRGLRGFKPGSFAGAAANFV